jgi:hypothetical protein
MAALLDVCTFQESLRKDSEVVPLEVGWLLSMLGHFYLLPSSGRGFDGIKTGGLASRCLGRGSACVVLTGLDDLMRRFGLHVGLRNGNKNREQVGWLHLLWQGQTVHSIKLMCISPEPKWFYVLRQSVKEPNCLRIRTMEPSQVSRCPPHATAHLHIETAHRYEHPQIASDASPLASSGSGSSAGLRHRLR